MPLEGHLMPEPTTPEGAPAPAPTPTSPAPAVPVVPVVPAVPPAPVADPWADPEAARKEIEALRKEAAGYRTKNKELEPLAAQAQALLDAQKSAEQLATERATAAEAKATAFRDRAVRAEVKALAADKFADSDDPARELDLASYVAADGEIDTKQMAADLDALLTRKPHWAKPVADPRRRPAPDASQGSSGNGQQAPATPAATFAGFLSQALNKGR